MVESKVKVAVRVRPMNQREIDLKAECMVHMEGKQTVLTSTSPTYDGNCTAQKEFLFDHCFWSVDDEDPAKYTSQEDIFRMLGEDLIDNIFAGFNSCIFTYGETGSGKTFSMMGTDDQPGLVPRICSALFSRDISPLKSLQVEVTYLEIYNEKVQDLLYPTSHFKALRVREDKIFGPYVEGLSHHAVCNAEDIKSLTLEGNKSRKISNPKMNEDGSQSHVIFTLIVTQTLQNERGVLKEFLSKVNLVDLAGSERTSICGATGDQQKESNINKSLACLGRVIHSLAKISEGKKKKICINYRDSILTWLLKDNLGGNSKTVMLATISPASVNYQETLSTLKYADSAKHIVNKAMVNEDIKSKAIIQLKEEVKGLRKQLQKAKAKNKLELEAKLNKSEKLIRDLKVSWEEKLKKMETSTIEGQKQLQTLGLTIEHTAIKVDEDKCYLINVSMGISNQNELLLYHLGEKTKIGAGDSQDIQVTGPGIELEHCVIEILQDGELFLTPTNNAETFVNDIKVQTVFTLSHEDKIQLGNRSSFMLHKPSSEPNNEQEGAEVTHNVISNQPEERNRQENEPNHEVSDDIQGSHGENTDCSAYMCTYSNDSRTMDSSGQNVNIFQNRSSISPTFSDTKQLEDQDSHDTKITIVETTIPPKTHETDDRNSQLKSIRKTKQSDEDDTIDNCDDRMEISITSTSQIESEQELSNKNQISKEDDDRTSISTNPTVQTEMEQNVSSGNQISQEANDGREISITSTSQTEMEEDLSSEGRICAEYNDKTEKSISPTSPSAELSIEDNLVTGSQDNQDKYGTSERHRRASQTAANYIRRSGKEIAAALQKDFNDFLNEFGSKNLITQEEYFTVESVKNVNEQGHALVNVILQKDESTCRAFLQCLQLNQDDLTASEEKHLPEEKLKKESKEKDKRTCFQDLLEKIGFQTYQTSKLTLHDVLDIGEDCLRPRDVAWYFIRKLMSLHAEARNISTIGGGVEMSCEDSVMLDEDSDLSGSIHPLDLQCAIFHCADHFLQQEMISKMSMCQFSVPLLLPASDGLDFTFMLWAMRGIVKKWRPKILADSKGFQEENLVKISMPTFSFVRMGKCRLSKSKILNQILSSTQLCQDIFVHRDMEGGNVERTISLGLVEISWYFPAGNSIFTEPVAFTNLRGELESNVKQFSFLADISSIVVVFAETISKTQCEFLLKYKHSTYLFIIAPEEQTSKEEINEMLESVMSMAEIKKDNVLVISRTTNEATAVKKIRSALLKLEKINANPRSVEDMAQIAEKQEICVDENTAECQAAKNHARAITQEICEVVTYKGETMTLQAQLLKDLSALEKELCQMKKQQNRNVENYKSELRGKCNEIRRKQWERHMPRGIAHFIEGIKTKNRLQKFYFLSWLKYYLDLAARKTLASLQEKYREKYSQASDYKELVEIDQKISDSSLGTEHFLREVSQFYEVWHVMGKKTNTHTGCHHLPETAADLLLDGYPLELIDGDASRIPVQWVSDVLAELDKKTGGQCRMRVITVLGVQSTGKSTLLNAMFGLQFPVASGRCTRGAFMTLIKVKENFRGELGCEFILVIDTEGLKAPELASLDDSYEHDNELATLVVGLSDITIVNMAMENTTEMKDILQIVVHAFLRMKSIGKKPNCQFVHQNVSDVSAHDKNMRDRKKLLEQLDEMTKVAAKMEKKSGFDKFSHVMDYDLDKHNWYIPGLWQGVPPMAPVNSGYSEHVSELKKYLLQFLKTQKRSGKALTIPAFLTWVRSLWTAVKHEKFIFSFRNSLVAEAYNKFSIQFSLWEWNFTKEVHKWVVRNETEIKNQATHNFNENKNETIKDLDQLLHDEEQKMIELIKKYYESESENINLIERYREDFKKSVTSLRKELRRNAVEKYEKALSIQKGKLKIKDMKEKYQALIEEKIDGLLKTCREKNNELSDAEVEDEFTAMWEKTLSDLQIEKLERRKVSDAILRQLRQDMSNKGPDINKTLLEVVMLRDHRTNFTINDNHIDLRWLSKAWKRVRGKGKEPYEKLGGLATTLTEMCDTYVTETENTGEDYDDTYCQEILQKINTKLEAVQSKNLHFTVQFELDIKLFIFGKASERFQRMHGRFIETNDPRTCMDNLKPDYLAIFLNVFKAKDESQSRGHQFCEKCLIPAITDYLYNHLGRTMVDGILNGSDNKIFKTRSFFQVNLLENLLDKMSFQNYVEYTNCYEKFSKGWILNKISEIYQKPEALEPLLADLISSISRDVKDILTEDTILKSESIPQFLENVQKTLKEKLVISQTAMKIISFNNEVNVRQFSSDIQLFLDSTEQQVLSDLKSMSFQSLLSKIKLKPQDELFRKVIGCGHQCPFCKVPCEAGGGDHKEHFASIHRPEGLGRYFWSDTHMLTSDICTTSVLSKTCFRNSDTDGKRHPYKDYRTYYPDWAIQPDPSIESSDYWKYVFAHFNERFAEQYDAQPAELPDDWKNITEEEALSSLKKTFNVC